MAISRYRNSSLVSGSYYSSYDFPYDKLSSVPVFNIRTNVNDRLDTLAFRYLGSGEYWWVIAMMNNIDWAFDFIPGDLLKIPVDIQDILRII